MLPEVKAGRLIRKRKHPAPPLTDIDPNFGVDYDETTHGTILRAELDVSHLIKPRQTVLTNLIKKYWCVFSREGVTTPVKDYECEINTVDTKPFALSLKRPLPSSSPLGTLSRFTMANGSLSLS